jgi:hypothetical protein
VGARRSGGIIAGRRRKRQRAARLRPIDIDSTATSSLFGPANGSDGRHASSLSFPSSTSATEESSPLLRYEWRSASGQTVVIEAGWPAGAAQGDLAPFVRVNDGHHDRAHGFHHAREHGVASMMDLRSDS